MHVAKGTDDPYPVLLFWFSIRKSLREMSFMVAFTSTSLLEDIFTLASMVTSWREVRAKSSMREKSFDVLSFKL